THSLSHLSDQQLVGALSELLKQERISTAGVLAHLAEIDARKLYLPAAYPSMYAYCVEELHFSEDAACMRIAVARASRQFPDLLDAIAEGRLHLRGAARLAAHLVPENAQSLIAASTGKTYREIEQLLAERFPRTEELSLVCAAPAFMQESVSVSR